MVSPVRLRPQRSTAVPNVTPPAVPLALLTDERVLVDRIRAGDAQAFEMLVRAYAKPVYELAFRYLRHSADAQEVGQDVFVRVWERRERWELRGSLRGYLMAAARNHALNALTARARREGLGRVPVGGGWDDASGHDSTDELAAIPGMSASPADAESMVIAAERTAGLRQAIGALSARRREVLMLRWESGLTYAEIATLLGITPKGVEMTHARAIQDLRTALANASWS